MSFGGSKKGGQTIPSENTRLRNPITYYREQTGRYPSNSQVWWAFKRPPEVGTDRPPKQYFEVFDPSLRHQISTGNAQASRGHYILEAFRQDRTAASNIVGIPVETSNGKRPTSVAFHGGRVFYAGVFNPGFNTKIYFSPIIERNSQAGRCYQEADPTAEDIRDLLPSDGGVLEIPGVSQVITLWSMGAMLFVFADNGIWVISGSQGVGFAANDFTVNKMSGVPCLSALSFVDVEGSPIWWNRSGIYTITAGENGSPTVQSLTKDTIDTLYNNIPNQSKEYAKGAFDPLTKTVQFIYRSEETEVEQELFHYDRVLVLDTRTAAWSPWDFNLSPRVQALGIFSKEGNALEQEIVRVLAGNDFVVAGDDDVVSIHTRVIVVDSKIKYIVNVLDDNAGVPEPPPPAPLPVFNVVSLTDNVVAGSDNVIATP